jgi:hypothetical protein
VTKQCHWIPWNEFFDNESKHPVLFPRPDGGRCCDNCQPEDFLYDIIELEGGAPRFSKRGMKSSDKLHVAIVKQLKDLRRSISKRDFAKGSVLVTGKTFMSDDIITRLATYAWHYANLEKIRQHSGWHWAEKHAEDVSRAIQEVLPGFPDPQEEAREAQRKEQLFREIQAMAREGFLKRFQKLANECDHVICSLTVPIVPGKPKVRFRARLFMCRPNKKVSLVNCNVSALWPAHQFGLQKYPDYYEGLIDCPITNLPFQ